MKIDFCCIPGDGIGPEIMQSALNVIQAVSKKFNHTLNVQQAWAGGDAWDKFGNHLPAESLEIAKSTKAILFGSVGGPIAEQLNPKWKNCESNSILALRKAFSFFANVRPIRVYKSLESLSPIKLKQEVDFVIIRELLGDVYFGRHEISEENGNLKALDTGEYTEKQITDIAHYGFQLAKSRKKKLASIDKANVLSMSKLWRQTVDKVAKDYPEVNYEHILVDACAMHLVSKPEYFDVVLAPNLFGDILSDLGAALCGSLGLLPSASFNKDGFALYEPSGGSAPDIAGKNIANPTGQILSSAMMLRHSFKLEQEANSIETAISRVFENNIFTGDLVLDKKLKSVSTSEFTEKVISYLN
jgi:3-isopropylmalate dehydrogenase